MVENKRPRAQDQHAPQCMVCLCGLPLTVNADNGLHRSPESGPADCINGLLPSVIRQVRMGLYMPGCSITMCAAVQRGTLGLCCCCASIRGTLGHSSEVHSRVRSVRLSASGVNQMRPAAPAECITTFFDLMAFLFVCLYPHTVRACAALYIPANPLATAAGLH
jgi:hypothetical protein